MKRIIKSQLYQELHNRSVLVVAIVTACMVGVEWYFILEDLNETVTGCDVLLYAGDLALFADIFFIFAVASFFCRDFKNKTLYCDIMAGYERKQVFFGRVIPGFAIGVLGTLILLFSSVIYYTCINGFGDYIRVSSMFMRLGLYVLLLFRLMGEIVLLSVWIKRMGIVYIVALLVGFGEQQFVLLSSGVLSQPLFVGGMAPWIILTVTYDQTFGEGGEITRQYDQTLPFFSTLLSAGSSVLIGGICLYIAYRIFKNQDMD